MISAVGFAFQVLAKDFVPRVMEVKSTVLFEDKTQFIVARYPKSSNVVFIIEPRQTVIYKGKSRTLPDLAIAVMEEGKSRDMFTTKHLNREFIVSVADKINDKGVYCYNKNEINNTSLKKGQKVFVKGIELVLKTEIIATLLAGDDITSSKVISSNGDFRCINAKMRLDERIRISACSGPGFVIKSLNFNQNSIVRTRY